jgi:hypothetical protein
MNAFAKPEEARPFTYPVFPKPPSEITEYTNVEGVLNFVMKNFKTAEPFYPGTDTTPVVQPVVFQDFHKFVPSDRS